MTAHDEGRKVPKKRPIVRDIELWHEVARSVTPMRPRRSEPDLPNASPAKADTDRPAKIRKSSPMAIAAATQAKRPERRDPTPLTGLDRRMVQRLSRGQLETDARIDLHGETLETGRYRLLGFLRNAVANGDRLVLVITGKGNSPFARHTLHGVDHFHAPEREGRLRRAFTHWLDEAEFRRLISGYQPAHPRHGGGGAFYVRLRRPDRAGEQP